jgi:glycogen synthase
MRVLMLGWEYPPHISGGLGTACEGLTKALAVEGVAIKFIVPRTFGDEDAHHMHLTAPGDASHRPVGQRKISQPGRTIELLEIDSVLRPYESPQEYVRRLTVQEHAGGTTEVQQDGMPAGQATVTGGSHYGGDLMSEVRRFAAEAVAAAGHDFDLIHAHDWMTWPAALEIRRATGKPLLAHVHSLEFDRSGEQVNESIHRIEHAGITGADYLITVSHYTKGVIVNRHGVEPSKISVVHNGVTRAEARERYHIDPDGDTRPIVLFLGRVTYQKGPEFFVQAAAKVLGKTRNVRFVVAGNGDMLPAIKQMVRELGLDDAFEFPGFVRGADRERWYSLASCFVMPSRSEPFGITPLEALACDTPVIVSRQSGVSEVLQHALKADFWDVDRMARLIIGVLHHDSMCEDMLEMNRQELTRLHWQAAAQKVAKLYHEVRTP